MDRFAGIPFTRMGLIEFLLHSSGDVGKVAARTSAAAVPHWPSRNQASEEWLTPRAWASDFPHSTKNNFRPARLCHHPSLGKYGSGEATTRISSLGSEACAKAWKIRPARAV